MNFIRVTGLFIALLCSVNAVNAAVFNIKNESRATIYVRPIWAGKPFTLEQLSPGQSMRYDSGFSNVDAIRWLEVISQGNGQMFIKGFETPVKLGAFNLGGLFKILKDGSYSFRFGIDGEGAGSATKADGL